MRQLSILCSSDRRVVALSVNDIRTTNSGVYDFETFASSVFPDEFTYRTFPAEYAALLFRCRIIHVDRPRGGTNRTTTPLVFFKTFAFADNDYRIGRSRHDWKTSAAVIEPREFACLYAKRVKNWPRSVTRTRRIVDKRKTRANGSSVTGNRIGKKTVRRDKTLSFERGETMRICKFVIRSTRSRRQRTPLARGPSAKPICNATAVYVIHIQRTVIHPSRVCTIFERNANGVINDFSGRFRK